MILKQNNMKIIIVFLFLAVFHNLKCQDLSKIKNNIFFKFEKAYFNITPFYLAPEEPLPMINPNNSVKRIIEYHSFYSERNNVNNLFAQDTSVYRICEFYPNNLFKSDEQEIYYYNKDTLLHIYTNDNDTTIYFLNHNKLPMYGIKGQDTTILYKYKDNLLDKVFLFEKKNRDTISYKYKHKDDKLEIYTFHNEIPQNKFVYSLKKDTNILENILFFEDMTYAGIYYYYYDNKLLYEVAKDHKKNIISTKNYIYDKQDRLRSVYEFSYNDCSVSFYYYNKHNDVNLIIKKSPCNHSVDIEIQKYKYEYFTFSDF